jgi:branched-chain amino acid transport system ATP-binding protein
MTALQVRGLSVSYGGVRAVRDVDFDLRAGCITGLIGPNGAGKTTCIDAITGFAPATGSVMLNGREVAGSSPSRRARAGLTRTWQNAELFEDLDVRQNVTAAAEWPSFLELLGQIFLRRRPPAAAVQDALDLVGVADLADRSPAELSLGQRKLAAVARAVAARPSVLCLDEPAAGLTTTESSLLGGRLRAIADDGLALLLVDHDMDLVLSICDEVTVLDFGMVIFRGPPEDARRDPAVVRAYLGTDLSEIEP